MLTNNQKSDYGIFFIILLFENAVIDCRFPQAWQANVTVLAVTAA